MLTLRAGYGVGYYTSATGGDPSAGQGVDYYLSATAGGLGEPAGQWHGKGAAELGLSGEVDPDQMKALYEQSVAPDGSRVGKRHSMTDSKAALQAKIDAAIESEGPYVTTERMDEIRREIRGKVNLPVSHYDLTYSVPKSASIAHASYLAKAAESRSRGDSDAAERHQQMADGIEAAVVDAARDMIDNLERDALFTRTGNHSIKGEGQWRDARGAVAALWLQHTNRDGEPQLHVHATVLNRVQRADMQDDIYRAVDATGLFGDARLHLGATTDRRLMENLTALGLPVVQRADGNGAEVGGLEDSVDTFSTRRQKITKEAEPLIREYEERHGHPPNSAALRSLMQQATLSTRQAKSHKPLSMAEQLDQWGRTSRKVERASLASNVAKIDAAKLDAPAPATFTLEDRQRACRAAVANLQAKSSAWTSRALTMELHRVLPATVTQYELRETVTLAMSGTVPGLEDIREVAPAAELADLSVFGIRESDGEPVVTKPMRRRYATQDQLDLEAKILAEGGRQVQRQVSVADAELTLMDSDLTPSQKTVAVGLLSETHALSTLVAPPGAGKSHTVAAFAKAHTALTGARVIGLTTSTVAARVLQDEGLSTSHNIADFLGRIKDSNRTRGHLPVNAGDVLVIDESSMLSTRDLSDIIDVARRRGARIIMTGDPEQLSSPESGGAMRLVASTHGNYYLADVFRFGPGWEAEASLRLRDGDTAVIAEYIAEGRFRGGTESDMRALAVRNWLGDYLKTPDSILIATTNAEVTELSRMAREHLVTLGRVSAETVTKTMDGNDVSTGDIIRARDNRPSLRIDGKSLANRDILRVIGWDGSRAVVERQAPGGSWSSPVTLPAGYVENYSELSYAGNTHVTQGRTVTGPAHFLITDSTDSASLTVGMTRSRNGNYGYAVTSKDMKHGGGVRPDTQLEAEPETEVTTVEAVISSAMTRLPENLTATEVIRATQDRAESMGHLMELWKEATRPASAAALNSVAQSAMSPEDYDRYISDPELGTVHSHLRAAELANRDSAEILTAAIGSRGFKGSRSIAAVITGRIGSLSDLETASPQSWVSATPEISDSAMAETANDLANGMDARTEALGMLTAETEPVWATRCLGPLPSDPDARATWEREAGQIAAVREMTGFKSGHEALGPMPSGGAVEIRAAWRTAAESAGMTPDQLETAAMSQGELEASMIAYEREQLHEPAAADLATALQSQQDAAASAQIAQELSSAGPSQEHLDAAQLAQREAERCAAYAEHQRQVDSERKAWLAKTEAKRQKAVAAHGEMSKRGLERVTEPAEVIHEADETDRTLEALRTQQEHTGQRESEDEHWRRMDDERRSAPWQPGVQTAAEMWAGMDREAELSMDDD